ncbi:MAG: peptidase dimerization domain-containing protein, partial [Acidobacteriota bacterium]
AGLRHELEAEAFPHAEHFPDVPYVALNLSTLEGGSAINIVPEHARLTFGFRVLPGMETDDLAARARKAVAAELDGEDWDFERLNFSPPMLMEENHALHKEVCGFSGQTETVSASYATDGGWLSAAGFDCLLYGPGTIEVAHRPDEWLPRGEFEQCSKDLAVLVERRCRGAA